jgi:hypothetical protein
VARPGTDPSAAGSRYWRGEQHREATRACWHGLDGVDASWRGGMTWLGDSTHRRCSVTRSEPLSLARLSSNSHPRIAWCCGRSSRSQTGTPERTPGQAWRSSRKWSGRTRSLSNDRYAASSTSRSSSAPDERLPATLPHTRSTSNTSKALLERVTEDSLTGNRGLHPPVKTSHKEPVKTSRFRLALRNPPTEETNR